MNRYTVVWEETLQNDFIERWILSDSTARKRLTAAANLIDAELAVSPQLKGTALTTESTMRTWHPSGLVGFDIVYEVLSDDALVRVLCIAVPLNS